MPELYTHQETLKTEIYQSWSNARNVVAVLPTGGGKTVIFSDIVREHKGATCVIAHRKELVCQMSLALARAGVRHRVIGQDNLVSLINRIHMEELGESWYHPSAITAVASVQTLTSKKQIARLEDWCKTITMWVIDEAHHIASTNQWYRAVSMFPNAKGLGVTATPCRADGKGLGDHADGVFQAMVEGPRLRNLIGEGYLSDYRIYAPESDMDLANIKMGSNGDYTQAGLKKASKRSRIIGDVVNSYKQFATGKLGITFSTDVETATDQAAQFNRAGVPAVVLSGKTPDAERVDAFRKFKNREIMMLVNCDLFGEGLDIPALEVVSLARPTESFSLFVQQCGRTLRVMDNKPHAIIIDHVGNVAKHAQVIEENGGLVIDLCARRWTLNRQDKRSRSAPDDAIPIKTCVSCLADYPAVHTECPFCGTKPIPSERSGPEFVDGDLTELDPAVLAAMQGMVFNLDKPVADYMAECGADRLTNEIAKLSVAKRFREKVTAQKELRESMGWWAAWQNIKGRSDTEAYKIFYFKFGTDVLTAQTLNTKDTLVIKEKIDLEIQEYNIGCLR